MTPRRAAATPPNTVIIFGAGASAAEGAPLQGALFSDYFGLNLGVHVIKRIAKMDAELRQFFGAFFGINGPIPRKAKKRHPTFEEALGIVELALQRGESFQDYPPPPANHDSSASGNTLFS